ncbi:MAG: DUF748 domain-containing protein [Cellvibrionaceae bacterium]
MKKRNTALAVFVVVLVVAVALRLALPWALEYYVNNKLANLDSYTGSVEDIDVALWRGAYQIQGMVIQKRDTDNLEPFFTGDNIDLSVEWENLLNGALVAELVFWNPQLNLVEAMEEAQRQTGEEVDWQRRFEELFPFRFNRIEVRNGTVRFRTPGIDSDDALTVTRMNGELRNLTNVVEVEDEAFAQFKVRGEIFHAPLTIEGRAEPTEEQPTFDVNLTLNQVRLTDLNPWLREYLRADAEAGTFALYLELAAAEGQFEGYAKPFTEDIEIFDMDDTSKGLLRSAWEAALDLAANIFEAPPEEDVASRVPISGTIEEPKAGIWRALINVLRHAVTGTFTRSLEGSISLEDGEVQNDSDDNGDNQSP